VLCYYKGKHFRPIWNWSKEYMPHYLIKCTVCNGRGKVFCNSCHGTGYSSK
jgi:hypothetical protein